MMAEAARPLRGARARPGPCDREVRPHVADEGAARHRADQGSPGRARPSTSCGSPRTPRRARLFKVVASAAANAENNQDLDRDTLVVAAAYADEGPTLKRIRPRAQGRAYRIRKRTSHITVEVESVPAKTGRGGRGGAKGRAR